MAEKRMFAKTIIDSDAFIEMPISARLLYYDLGMRADDDGFVNSPKKIMRMIGASDDDMRILAMRKFIIPFDNGLVVIKHWRINNYLRSDRYQETTYKDEKSLLLIDENNAYTLSDDDEKTSGIPLGIPMVDADKNRLDKNRLDKNIYVEVVDYLNSKIGSKYMATSKATREKIHARVAQGFTVEDFKTVIDKKVDEWKGTEREKFLRPDTLFSPKFEGYLNQNIIKAKSSNPFLEMLREEENDTERNEAVTGDIGSGVQKLLQGR